MRVSAKIEEIKNLYENGVPVKIITQIHSISRQTVSKYAAKFEWSNRRHRPSTLHENIEAKTRRAIRERRSTETRIATRHQHEFQIVRHLIQSAIDHECLEKASLAKCVSETLMILHQSELAQFEHGQVYPKRLGSTLSISRGKSGTEPRQSGLLKNSSTTAEYREGNATLIELFDQWKNHRTDLSRSTISHWRKALNAFIEFVGHSNPALLTRHDVIRWRDWLLAKNYARKTIESSYLGAPRAILNFALLSGTVQNNPFQAVSLPPTKVIRRRSKAYSDQEARLILVASHRLARGQERDHVYHLRKWGPWIAAFTGARINEICQLRRQDIKLHDDIWCLHITPAAGPVKSKTDRIIPIHPQLIALGFIDFVNSQRDGYIFSHDANVSGARDRSKVIGVWVRSLGIKDPDISPNHAWRHRFKTICRQIGIQTEYHNALTGHANDRSIASTYGEFPVKALYREICKVPHISIR